MSKYFGIQLKRLWRVMPIALWVMALLFGGVYLVYQGVVAQWTQSSSLQKMDIATVGTNTDPVLQMGLDAVKQIDSSSMSINFVDMDEEQAVKALQAGTVKAYIVFPQSFLHNAYQGVIEPLRFVSTAASENIVSMVKDELTSALATIVISSEQAAFAVGDALADLGYDSGAQYDHINSMAIRLAAQVLGRDEIYTLEELGISAGLNFEQYMLCGLSVVFLFLMALPFVSIFVKNDFSLEQLLMSKRLSSLEQTVCELLAYTLFLYVLSVLLLPLIGSVSLGAILYLVPITFCTAAISYLIYSLSKELISGVLLQMVVTVALCFVSGCFYPVYFFPVSVQEIAGYLPAGVARLHISGLITGEYDSFTTVYLLAVGFVCMGLCVLIRYLRIRGRKEVKR